MAKNVNDAFDEFMKNSVNLDRDVVSSARKSRDNLIDNISEFNDDNTFFTLCQSFNVHFGSFARKTKCKELDDIDLMIGISADEATYNQNDSWDNVTIYASSINSAQKDCMRSDGTLNSTQVINKFKKKLESVREYSHSDVNKKGEAVVLNLKSKDWSFDIVPCFHTVTEDNGRSYYLIPNGNGNWKKTDPLIDKEHVSNTNQEKDGRVLELIRLCKKWNKVKNVTTIPSYLLETLIINYCDEVTELSQWIDFRFRDALKYISKHIYLPVYDMKDIQGNINELEYYEQIVIAKRAKIDYDKACEASKFETQDHDYEKSINKWREILGGDFPEYDE